MKSFDLDLNNPFDDPLITNPRMDSFVTSLLTKFGAANSTHQYDIVIADITTPFSPFHTAMMKLVVDNSQTIGQTEFRVDILDEFKAFASEYYGIVKQKYKLDKPKLITFYLHGMKTINAINKTTAPGILSAFALAVATNHADWDVPYPLFVSRAAAFPIRYTNAKSSQDSGKLGKGTDRGSRNVNRKPLNVAVFDAYNYVKYVTSCDPAKVKAIFGDMQALIPSTRHEIEHHDGTTPAMLTANACSNIYDATIYVKVTNKGNGAFRAGLALDAVTSVETTGKTVNAGKSCSFQIITTGPAGAHFFNISGIDLAHPSIWEIEIYTKK